MRIGILLLLTFVQLQLFGQYIDGPANVRTEPQGEVIFSLDNYLYIDNYEILDNWYKIRLIVYVDIDSSKNNLVQKGVVFRDLKGNRIGVALSTFEYNADFEKNINNLRKIIISGYTFKNNIVNNIPDKFKPENKNTLFVDSSVSYIKKFYLDDGQMATDKVVVDYYSRSCFYDRKHIIRETKKERRYAGAEGSNSQITCDFIYNNDINDKDNFTISHHCDDIHFERDYYWTKKYGCCGAETYYELFNYKNSKPLIQYNVFMIKIVGGDDGKKYFIGYLPINSSDELILGKLYFSDEKERINEITFQVKNEEIFDKILPWTPEINFSPEKYELTYQYPREPEYEIDLNMYNSNLAPNVYNFHLDDVTIDIEFVDDSTGDKAVIKIPIIHGMLFGSSNNRTVIVEELKSKN